MYKKTLSLKAEKLMKLFFMLLLLSFTTVACDDDDDDGNSPPEPMTLAMLAEEQENLSLFLQAVEQAGLTSALQNTNSELTVFAPTNQAFQALLTQLGVELNAIPQEQLRQILQYHIVQGMRLSDDLSTGTLTSLNNGTIDVLVDGGVTLNGTAEVVTANLEASNGVIHIIDEVLLMEPAEDPTIAALLAQEEDLSILADILSRPAFADVVAAASNTESTLTVFAPTNTYFEQLLEQLGKSSVDELPEAVLTDIVTYHILGESVASTDLESSMYMTLQGEEVSVTTEGGVMINDTEVAEADLMTSNGYVHKIEGVLFPPEARMVYGTVAGIAYFDANFTTLVAALRQANLLSVLMQEGPYTVFAPTNAAFEAAGITDLSTFSEEELQNILLYHVVGASITADQLEEGPVTTASEEEFYVSLTEEGAYLNGHAMVTAADLAADNGVVHVLDGVIVPPTQNLAEIVIAQASAENPQFTLLLQAVQRAGLASTLAEGGPFTVFAPTDAAFEAAGFDSETIASTAPEVLENVLLYHVVPGRVFSVELTNGDVMTAQEGTIAIDATNLTVTDQQENTANLNAEMLDILATNGVIHVIDAVLMPAE